MAAGEGMRGFDISVTAGGSALAGQATKTASSTNQTLDVTDDASSGHQELMAQAGLRAREFTAEGPLKNLELLETFYNGASMMVEIIETFPDGSTLTGDYVMSNFDYDASDTAGVVTWSASFSSSGAPVFVAAT